MIYLCNGMPCAVFDGVLSNEEAQQFDKIISNTALQEGRILGSAVNSTGEVKKNKGVWLDNFRPSNTYGLPADFIDRVVMNAKKECPNWVWRYCDISSEVNCLVSYYENGDKYHEHFDLSKMTILLWLHKGERGFSGGDLVLEDGQVIEFANNRAVLFPSVLNHSVTEVIMKPGNVNGRYCITGFFV